MNRTSFNKNSTWLRFLGWWIFWSALVVIGIQLCLWQFNRAIEKEQLISQWQTSSFTSPTTLPVKNYSRIQLTGKYLLDQSLWWDNRIYQGQVGIALVTPFVDNQDRVWLINRGFLDTNGSRQHFKIPIDINLNAEITIQGIWQGLSKKEFVLGINREGNRIQTLVPSHWPELTDLPAGVIHQTKGDGLLQPFWQPKLNAAQRHYGYSLQWALLALIALFFSIKLRPRRPQTGEHTYDIC